MGGLVVAPRLLRLLELIYQSLEAATNTKKTFKGFLNILGRNVFEGC